MANTKAAIENIVKAVDEGRTDVVRGVINVYEKGDILENDDEEYSLDNLLNSLWTPEGTFMHRAAKNGKCDIVRALLHAGADPGVHNSQHQTALDLVTSQSVQDVFSEDLLNCIARADIGRMCQLVASGVSVNLHDSPESRNTPLHWAATFGNRDVIQCLCKRGGNVNAVNGCGASPLHDAVARGDCQVVSELLTLGADSTVVAHSGKYGGKSPVDLTANNVDLMNLLHQSNQQTVLMNGDHDRQSVTSDSNQSIIVANNNSSLHNGPVTPSLSEPVAPMSPDANTGLKFTQMISDACVSEEKDDGDFARKQPLDPLTFLWPKPKHLTRKPGRMFKAKETLVIYVAAKPAILHHCLRVCSSHSEAFRQLVLSVSVLPYSDGAPLSAHHSPHVLCHISDTTLPHADSYTLLVQEHQVKIQAGDASGLFYAMCTLVQLLRSGGSQGIPQLKLHDSPSLRERGVLLDMSKGRILTLNSLKNLLENLAFLKINQVQLYHRVQPLTDQEQTWQFPHSSSAVLELVEFCSDRCIELVPVLDVGPKVSYDALPELKAAMHEFVACFTSARHIGIGPRLSTLLVEVSDTGELSVEDMYRTLPILPHHHTAVLCAYVFHDLSSSLLSQLPINVALAEYGFMADFNFDKACSLYSQSSVPFYVVPGTAAWNSVAGCPEAAVANIYNASKAALSHHALGMLLSHWSGAGHMTHQPMAWPAFVTAAGLAWNANVPQEFLHCHLAELMNQHVLWDKAGVAGQVIIELGRAETYLLRCSRNQSGCDHSDLPPEKGSTIYQLLSQPDQVALEHLAPDHFQKTMRHIRKCLSELQRVQLQRTEAPMLLAELQLTADLMLTACRIGRALVNAGKNPLSSSHAGFSVVNMGVSNLPATTKTDLANRLLSLIDQYRISWLHRHLSHGLNDSLVLLSTMLAQFVPNAPSPDQQQD